MQKKMVKGRSTAAKLGIIGAGIAGLAASYYFLGPNGKAHRVHAKAWAIKMKGDVVEKLEKTGVLSESVYHGIVDSVASEYVRGKKAGEREIGAIAADLKKHWKNISHSARSAKRDLTASASRVAKKAGL